VKNPHKWKSTDEISSQLISIRQKKILDGLRNIDSLIHIFLRSKKRENITPVQISWFPFHRDTPGTWEVEGELSEDNSSDDIILQILVLDLVHLVPNFL
jgi:hypothetical protein